LMSSLHSIVRRVLLAEAPAYGSDSVSKTKKEKAQDVAFASFMVKAMSDIYRSSDKIARVVDLGTGEPINMQPDSDFNSAMMQLVAKFGDPETAAGRRRIQEKLLAALKSIYTTGAEKAEKNRWPLSALNIQNDRYFNSVVFPDRVFRTLLALASRQQVALQPTGDVEDDLPDVTSRIASSGINFPAFSQLVAELDETYSFFQTSERRSAVHDKIGSMRRILVEIAQEVLGDEDAGSKAQVVTLGRRGQRSAGEMIGLPYGLTESMFDLGGDIDLEMDKNIPTSSVPMSDEDEDVASGASVDNDEDNLPDVDDDTEAAERVRSLRGLVDDVAAYISDSAEGTAGSGSGAGSRGPDLAVQLSEAMDEIADAAGVSQQSTDDF